MVAVIGFFIGSRFIPSQNQFFLELAGKFALPILELSLITYLVINISKIRKIFKLNRLSMDRASTVRTAIQSVYQGRIASFMSDEILFFYYAFFNWGKYTLKENEFSYHKKSGITAIYGGLIFLVIVETFVLHLVISPYIPFLAWTITLLSIYSAFILFGLVRSLSHLPIKVEQNSLKLQYGLINRVTINFDTIKEISITKSSEDVKRISLLGALEEPNVLIHLKELATMTSIYGFKSKFQKLGIILDEPIKFVELMRSKTIHQN